MMGMRHLKEVTMLRHLGFGGLWQRAVMLSLNTISVGCTTRGWVLIKAIERQ